MSSTSELHVVIGASGAAGNAVVRELVRRGQRVRAVNRSGHADGPHGVEVIRGDVADAASARAFCQGAAVVYNCANPEYTQWAALFPAIMAGSIEGAAAAGAKLVFADNVYMYGPVDGPITEDLPYRATGKKGRLRAELATTLMEAHAAGKVRATIGRGADYYGPGVLGSAAGEDYFGALLAGKKAMWVGSLDMPHSLTFIDDFARGLVTLGERDEALGQAWHIPCGEALTGRQFAELAFAEAGLPPRIGCYSPRTMRMVGLVSPIVREVNEMMYEFDAPFVVDGSQYERAFGPLPVTPHREALRPTLAWFRAHPKQAAA